MEEGSEGEGEGGGGKKQWAKKLTEMVHIHVCGKCGNSDKNE